MAEDSVFKHRKCGGRLTVDLQSIFMFISPSISVGTKGIGVGPIELKTRDKGKGVGFVCAKCQSDIPHEKLPEDAVVHCFVCREDKPLGKMLVSQQIPAICEECAEYLSERKKNPPEKVRAVMPYINLKDSGLSFVPYLEMLKNPVIF